MPMIKIHRIKSKTTTELDDRTDEEVDTMCMTFKYIIRSEDIKEASYELDIEVVGYTIGQGWDWRIDKAKTLFSHPTRPGVKVHYYDGLIPEGVHQLVDQFVREDMSSEFVNVGYEGIE